MLRLVRLERLAELDPIGAGAFDNLIATLDRIALDLGSSAAALDQRIGQGVLDMRADDLFFSVKGQAHGYALVLRELEKDFAAVVRERDVATLWRSMLASLSRAASLDPLVVVNGAPDGAVFPSHLAAQGFRSAIVIPLMSRNRAIGTLTAISRTPGAFTATHRDAMQPMAEVLAFAFVAQQQHAALQRYLTYKQTPELLKAHRVKPATEEHTLSLRARILENLKKLRARWF